MFYNSTPMYQKTKFWQTLQRNAGAGGHRVQRILCNMKLNGHLLGQSICQAMQQCAATCQINTIAHDVGIKLRRCLT